VADPGLGCGRGYTKILLKNISKTIFEKFFLHLLLLLLRGTFCIKNVPFQV